MAVPPPSLIPGRMIFRMVDGAKGHSKFVADLKRESSGLRVTNVMRMEWGAIADEAGLARPSLELPLLDPSAVGQPYERIYADAPPSIHARLARQLATQNHFPLMGRR